MSYKKDLIDRIKNSEKWPSFERSDFLSELNIIADNAFKKDTIEGYLAAVLIYHQLCEELLKLLIECSRFYIQIAIFPAEISFKNITKKTFGQVIDELKSGINFNKKEELINHCKQLNKIRIKIVHKLTLKNSTSDIKKQVKEFNKIFDEIFKLYESIYDEYRVNFHSYKKDIDWDDYLSET